MEREAFRHMNQPFASMSQDTLMTFEKLRPLNREWFQNEGFELGSFAEMKSYQTEYKGGTNDVISYVNKRGEEFLRVSKRDGVYKIVEMIENGKQNGISRLINNDGTFRIRYWENGETLNNVEYNSDGSIHWSDEEGTPAPKPGSHWFI